LFIVPSTREQPVTLDGAPVAVGHSIAAGAEGRLFRFAGGSEIALAADSNLQVRAANEQGVSVSLGSGTAKFDVRKRPGTDWTIDAGPFQVRVLGTAFGVEWSPQAQQFAVWVTRGTVMVHGPMLERTQPVTAGERCVVDLKAGRASVKPLAEGTESRDFTEQQPTSGVQAQDAAAELPANDPLLQEPSSPDKAAKARAAQPTESSPGARIGWQELERMGRFEKAVEEAERSGLDAIYDLASARDLMSLARSARFAGRPDISTGALLSCRRRFPASRDAAMAAYLLGRNAAPGVAVRWFSTYLAEQPNGDWAREAAGRLVEAQQASGNTEAARAAAQKYLLQYPNGPHAKFAKGVLEK
jgi:hypothetical protein